MKLKDCDCGGIPEISYNIDDKIEFVVACVACGNQTPACRNLREAVTSWNQKYCCGLHAYEMESV
jgi:hypothetical protein